MTKKTILPLQLLVAPDKNDPAPLILYHGRNCPDGFGAALAAWTNWWNTRLPAWSLLLQGVNALAGFGLATLGFAMIYKIMPRVRIAWRDVWVGAAVTALLFSAGRTLIGLYIGRSGVSSGFGAAGSLVVVLVWVYWSAQIFLLGAEFTWVWAHARGSRRPAGPIGGVLQRAAGFSDRKALHGLPQ